VGHIIKTPAGTFRANWRDPSGRQKAKTFKTRKEAAAYLAATETTVTQGTYIDPQAGRMLFKDFAARWLVSRDVEARTAERTLSLLRTHLLPRWGRWQLARIDYMSVQEWVADLGKVLAPATVAKCLRTLFTILDAAIRARRIATNPADGVKVPKDSEQKKPRASTLTREEFFSRLLPALPESYRAIVCAAAGAGLRWGECAGLPWGAVDLVHARIRVAQVAVETPTSTTIRPYTKTRAGIRTVPMPEFLATALTVHRDRQGDAKPAADALVFASRLHTPQRRSNFRRRVWLPALRRAGLPLTLRFHDLRHSYATWLVTDGVPINAVQAVMGHANASTTLNRYTHKPNDYEDRVRATFTTNADDLLTFGPDDNPDDDDDDGSASLVPA
jgi:integrase